MFRLFTASNLYRPATSVRFSSTVLEEITMNNYNNRLRVSEERYADSVSTPFPSNVQAALDELAQETIKSFDMPAMMIGHVYSKYLHQLVHVLQPSRILEIGTFTGTSTISMSLALRPGGKIISLDVDSKAQEVAHRYVNQLQLTDRVDFRLGNGLESLATIAKDKPQFDMVFLDADKSNYISYFDMIVNNNLLSDRGMIIADNVLFCGKVHRDAGYEDPAPFKYPDIFTTGAKSILEFNQHVLRDPRVHQVTLPLFDGVSIIIKKRE